jgi:nucleoside-diphosphate-sugar epimerase
MEELVRSLFPEKYLIVRLPQVVGMVKNTTLFPELVRRIHGGLPVLVQRNATRSLIDIDDVVRITNKLIEVGARGLEINCIPDETLSVSDIVDFISDEIGCPADRVCVDEGVAQDADSRLMRQYLCEEDPVLLPGYTRFVVSKYAKKLIDDEARKPT